MIELKDSEIFDVIQGPEELDAVSVDDDTLANQLYINKEIVVAMGLQKGRKVTSYFRGPNIVGISIPGEKVAFIMPVGA